MTYDEFVEKVTRYDQKHLIKLYERLDEKKKIELLNQVSNINFDEVEELYNLTKVK